VFVANLLVLHIDNESIKWSLSIIVQICDNNQLFLVCLSVCYQPTLVACMVIILCGMRAICRFLLFDAMLSGVYAVVVCLSVSLCVCMYLSHSGIVSKWLNV